LVSASQHREQLTQAHAQRKCAGLASDSAVSVRAVHYPHVVPIAEFVANTIDRISTVAMTLASIRSRLGPGEESQRLASAFAELDLIIPGIRALAGLAENDPPRWRLERRVGSTADSADGPSLTIVAGR